MPSYKYLRLYEKLRFLILPLPLRKQFPSGYGTVSILYCHIIQTITPQNPLKSYLKSADQLTEPFGQGGQIIGAAIDLAGAAAHLLNDPADPTDIAGNIT